MKIINYIFVWVIYIFIARMSDEDVKIAGQQLAAFSIHNKKPLQGMIILLFKIINCAYYMMLIFFS